MHVCVGVGILIGMRWFKQWKKYVGFDDCESNVVGEESANPGPIDNSDLFEGKSLLNQTHVSYHN